MLRYKFKPWLNTKWQCLHFLLLFTHVEHLFSQVADRHSDKQIVEKFFLGILRDKTMEVKLMYIPNNDTQNKPFVNYYYLRKKVWSLKVCTTQSRII